LEDLWPFNEEVVARSIFDSRIPVISAVGHEIDYTIADLAADLRAPTPSAAIELALPEANELLKNLSEARLRIKNNLETRIKNLRQRLQWVLKSGAIAYPERLIKEYYQRLDENRRRVEMAVSSAVDSRKSRLQALMGALKALDPLAVLKRGYSICRKLPENLVVTDAEMLNKGDKVNLTFHRGYAFSRVEKAEVDSLKL
jgi:exodeoxyribonuclease VII large subunit